MGWVSWPLYIFVILASFSALWWPNIWSKIGFPELFENTVVPFITYLAFTLMGWVSWPLLILVLLAPFSALWCMAKYLAENGVSKTFEKIINPISTWLQNRNLYWIFLDEVGSDQSGGMLSPFMGIACCHCVPHPLRLLWDTDLLYSISQEICTRFLLCCTLL